MNRPRVVPIAVATALALVGTSRTSVAVDEARVAVDDALTVHLPALEVPFSEFASSEAKGAFRALGKFYAARAGTHSVAEQRRLSNEQMTPALKYVEGLFSVNTAGAMIGGIYADVITPKEGVSPRNEHRVLIELHGGAFTVGARVAGPIEAIPVASLGRIKIVSPDYRQGPEYQFPAASLDVLAVYRELIKSYAARNIGIYGSSSGGLLTAEVIASIEHAHLPAPGAIGIFCASAAGWTGGDSGTLALPLSGITPSKSDSAPPHPSVGNVAYFSDADFEDPLVAPLHSSALLSKFPPTLVITATRDPAMSSAVYTHAQLIKLGVDADLHVWEGLLHGFYVTNPELPESREVWTVINKFFDTRLGT